MSFPLLEQVRKRFSNPFKGFEEFFDKEKPNYKSVRKIRLPSDHELRGNLKSMRLIEFNSKENFEEKAVLIEDRSGNKFIVSVCEDTFNPVNRGSEGNTATIVYGKTSKVGSIGFIQKNAFEKLFDVAEKVTFDETSKWTTMLSRLGIRSNDVYNNIQLSGANVVVIEDFKSPKTVNSALMLKTISFLFGPNGPLNNILIFPSEGQENLMEQIRLAGGNSILSDSLTLKQFSLLRDKLYVDARTMIDARMSEVATEYLVRALMSHVPDIIHTYKRLEMAEKTKGGEVCSPPPQLELYIEEQLKNKLELFVESI